MKRIYTAGKAVLALLALGAPVTSVMAQSPEQLEQLEPDGGEWQVEYYGEFGTTDNTQRQHSIEAMYGISDQLAIGVEIEGEAEDGDFAVGEFGVFALLKFNDPDEAAVGLGVMASVGVDKDGVLAEAELRLIAEKQTETWWLQANGMLRRVNEEGERGELLAYGWNVSRAVTDDFWLGVEGSGQAAKIGGFDNGFDKAHFLGPAAQLDVDLGQDSEVEIGLAWLRRISGEGPRDTARLYLQFEF